MQNRTEQNRTEQNRTMNSPTLDAVAELIPNRSEIIKEYEERNYDDKINLVRCNC